MTPIDVECLIEFVYGYRMFSVICGINYVVYKKPAKGVVRTDYGLSKQDINLDLANRPLNHPRQRISFTKMNTLHLIFIFDMFAISVSGVHLQYMLQET